MSRIRATCAPVVVYPLPSNSQNATNGNTAYNAAANNGTSTTVTGSGTPAPLITVTATPVAIGKFIIDGYMYVTDATPGEAVTFTIKIGPSALLTIATIVLITDASGNASATFSLIRTQTSAPQIIEITASATHNLTVNAGQLSYQELPA